MTKEKQHISIFDECSSEHFLVQIFKHTEKFKEFCSENCQMTKLKQSRNSLMVFVQGGNNLQIGGMKCIVSEDLERECFTER